MKNILLIFKIAGLFTLLFTPQVPATIIFVPQEQSTIQAGINAAIKW